MESRVFDLVDQWEEARRSGRDISLDELCHKHPELCPEVEKAINALRATNWMTGSVHNHVDEVPQCQKSAAGRYRLQRLIGRGGFGEVWEAIDPELNRPVAVKIPRDDRSFDPAKSLNEARKVALLKHPGIVPVHDVGHLADGCYIVCDLIDGQNLADWLQSNRPSSNDSALLVASVADALDYAHSHGLVHRDVKPQNILIDRSGRPHLTDFGIALWQDQTTQTSSVTAGTLAYMSPEQASGQQDRMDSRTDIYSLGVVLYELLTGRLPFTATDPMDLWASVVSCSPRTPRTLNRRIPVSLERICLKAIAKQPENRFSTAGDFAIALRQAVKYSQRNFWPQRAAMAAACVIASLGGWWIVHSYRSAWRTVEQSTTASQQLGTDVLNNLDTEFGAKSENIQITAAKQVTATPAPDLPSVASTPVHEPVRISFTTSSLDLSGRSLTDEDFRVISGAFTLRSLDLSGTPTTDAQLQILGSLATLERLDLSRTQISDKSLSALTGMPALQYLSLAGTSVTDKGMRDLTSLHLRELDISRTSVTSKGVAQLCGPTPSDCMLEVLKISETKVDSRLLPIMGQLKRLRELDLSGTEISVEQLDELRKAGPEGLVVH